MRAGRLQTALLMFTKKSRVINDAYKKCPDPYIACGKTSPYLCFITDQYI
jgi:hypothetical protein